MLAKLATLKENRAGCNSFYRAFAPRARSREFNRQHCVVYARACNPRIWEAKAGEAKAQGHTQLHSEERPVVSCV